MRVEMRSDRMENLCEFGLETSWIARPILDSMNTLLMDYL